MILSQVPPGFNYQALARDDSGMPLSEATIQVRLVFLTDIDKNIIVWDEVHSSVVTDKHGIFSVVAGTGAMQPSSAVPSFRDINWSVPSMFIRTYIYYQKEWHEMGTSRLWSVPYATSAGTINSTLPKLSVAGITNDMEEALFEVKNQTGQTVFAVYNEGVRVYVGDGSSKATKGGFAIGSFEESKGVQDLLVVNADCVRVFIDNNPSKPVKGGFAIGSFEESKAGLREYLRVTDDSTRVYVRNSAKATKGGFAIGSFEESKATPDAFMVMTPENYLIGYLAGSSITEGQFNSFVGYRAGEFTSTGNANLFMGYYAGYSNTTGVSNTFLGRESGFNNTVGNRNIFIGDRAGYSNIGDPSGDPPTIGHDNIYIGTWAGRDNIAGQHNTLIGSNSGYKSSGTKNTFVGAFTGFNSTGAHNVFFGVDAGRENIEGDNNTFIGTVAGRNNSGSKNTFVGFGSGYYNSSGTGNVFIGNEAGPFTSNISNKLYINNAAGTPLIYGDFDAKIVTINGSINGKQLTLDGSSGLTQVQFTKSGGYKGAVGYNNDNDYFYLYSGGTVALKAGKLGVGTTNPKGEIHATGDLVLGLDQNNRRFILHSRTNGNGDFLNITSDDASGNWLWNNGIMLNRSGQVIIGGGNPGTHKLYVSGSAYSTGGWSGSDIKWKKNIVPLSDVLPDVIRLQGVTYDWKSDEFPEIGFSKRTQIGLIAQEVEKVFPLLVMTDRDGSKAIAYDKLSAVLVEAVKEQQREIEEYKNKVSELQNEVEAMRNEMAAIKQFINAGQK